MGRCRVLRWLPILLVAILGLAFGPGSVSAHGVTTTRFAAPLPLSFLVVGAGATVGFTALGLAAFNKAGESRSPRRYPLTVPSRAAKLVRYTASGFFLVVVLVALYIGVTGRQVPVENFATVFTWSVWFHGIALLAILVSDPWPLLSPWRTIYRGICRIEGRPLARLGEYPNSVGAWPALIGFLLLLGIVENLTVIPRSPRLTVALIATYAFVMLGGAILYGRQWLWNADPLGILYRLFGRVSPIIVTSHTNSDSKLALRPPWAGSLNPVSDWQLVVFIVAMVYTVSFDGFTNTSVYQTIVFSARTILGTSAETGIILYGAGLIGFIVSFGLCIVLVERLGAGDGQDWLTAARWFAPTVLPIAAAYEIAHTYPYVLKNLGQLLTLVLNLSALETGPIQLLGWLSLPLFWGSQVILILLGHVVAVVAAHYVAVDRYDSTSTARRGHVPLVTLMVGYTALSLWIISQPVVAG